MAISQFSSFLFRRHTDDHPPPSTLSADHLKAVSEATASAPALEAEIDHFCTATGPVCILQQLADFPTLQQCAESKRGVASSALPNLCGAIQTNSEQFYFLGGDVPQPLQPHAR